MAMMYPRAAMGALTTSSDPVWRLYDGYCEDKEHILSHTTINALRSSLREAGAHLAADMSANHYTAVATPSGLQNFLELGAQLDRTPPPTRVMRLPAPLRILMWRVDIPPRAIMYTGAPDIDAARVCSAPAPFHMQKEMLNVKRQIRTVGHICSIDGPMM